MLPKIKWRGNNNGNVKNLIDDKETYESIKGTLNVILKGNQCKILKVQWF